MIQPLNGRILIKPDRKEEMTKGGILLAQETLDKDRPETGAVIVGNETIPVDAHIVFSMYGYDEVEHEGETYFIVAEHNVLALIQ